MDPTGSVVPNVRVTVTSTDTGLTYTAVTDIADDGSSTVCLQEAFEFVQNLQVSRLMSEISTTTRFVRFRII